MFRLLTRISNSNTIRIKFFQSNAIREANLVKRSLSSAIRGPEPNDATLTIELQKNYGQESVEQKRSRLCYQSRKRGMLENGLLLGCFASKYLNAFNAKQLDEYDYLINKVSNDWDLYYWAVGKEQVPDEFNSSVFKMLKEFSLNELKESRIKQPDLKF